MPKEEWGTKRVCPKTGKRFYDLGKNPVISPYTGEILELEADAKPRPATPQKPEEAEDDGLSLAASADDGVESSAKSNVPVDDELLEDDDEDSVSLDEITDVAADEDEG